LTAAVILNPRAGGGAAGRRWPAVARLIRERLGSIEVFPTEMPGHATEIAGKLAGAGFDTLIAAGGDGTLSEVVNGILPGAPGVRIALIPIASGGDFARSLGLGGPSDAIEALAAGCTRPVDVVRVSFGGAGGALCERRFLNIASLGLGAAAAGRMRRWRGFLPRRARYLAAAIPELARHVEYRMRLAINGAPARPIRAATLALANGRYQGGGILIAPRAALDDGLMDLTLVEPVGLLEVAANFRLLYSGAIYSHPKVRHYLARRLRVEAESPVPLELDGDAMGSLPLEAEVEPRALCLIAPATAFSAR
jgi:diacylglycerol kinase (ATP)